MAETQAKKKSVFETPLLSTKIKTNSVKLFPEAFLGYLAGPMFAMIGNGVINAFLIQYWDKVLNLKGWAPVFEILLPIISAIIIIIGNLLVGRLMTRKPTMAGKARPFILLGIPFLVIAMLMLFFPWSFPAENADVSNSLATLIVVAVGYNLYYAFAWPFYYTPHASLVNLSTRDGNSRGLLATLVNAGQLGAAGIAGMFGGILADALRLLPQRGYFAVNNVSTGVEAYTSKGGDFGEFYSYFRQLVSNPTYVNADGSLKEGVSIIYENASYAARQDANSRWIIIMLVMLGVLVVGCLLEYFFTRERITEEQIKLEVAAEAAHKDGGEVKEKKTATMAQQIKIAIHDKYWWFIIIFFFLYQFGGMMKNNSSSFFSQSIDGGTTVSSVINTVGAIPTALGMVAIFPLSKKFGKAKCILVGGIVAAVMGCIGFATLPMNGTTDIGAITAVSVLAFCLKALGTVPAMYISMALMADVLEHQEAVSGVRTDGFTMAVYGSIMVAMAGITNGIIAGLNIAMPNNRPLNTFLFFGVESIAYLVIALMFIFMKVEKFSKADHAAIIEDQKAQVLAEGGTWIEPEERAKMEEEENARLVEAARIEELKNHCAKQNLNFAEEEAKYQAKKAEADKAAAEKKAEADAKKAAKEAEKKAAWDALPAEKKAAIEAKRAAKAEKKAAEEAQAAEELAAIRAAYAASKNA